VKKVEDSENCIICGRLNHVLKTNFGLQEMSNLWYPHLCDSHKEKINYWLVERVKRNPLLHHLTMDIRGGSPCIGFVNGFYAFMEGDKLYTCAYNADGSFDKSVVIHFKRDKNE
jgi:hypothetical protein